MTVLVVYGSKRGGTEGLAEMVADGLRQEGLSVDVASAWAAPDPERFEAVVVGGARTGAREHVTFGGRLSVDARGFPASAMAKKSAGDWRDPERVRAWTHRIASQLRTEVIGCG